MLSGNDRDVERTVRSAGKRDQAVSRFIEPGYFDVRPFLRCGLKISARTQLHQAAVTALVGGEQDKARPIVLGVAVFDVAKIDRHGATDDRLNPRVRQLLREFQRPEHTVGIAQGERRLPVVLCKLGQSRNRQGAFEQRVGRMNVQMHESGFTGHLLRRTKSPHQTGGLRWL
jgi:hypothetical protein